MDKDRPLDRLLQAFTENGFHLVGHAVYGVSLYHNDILHKDVIIREYTDSCHRPRWSIVSPPKLTDELV